MHKALQRTYTLYIKTPLKQLSATVSQTSNHTERQLQQYFNQAFNKKNYQKLEKSWLLISKSRLFMTELIQKQKGR